MTAHNSTRTPHGSETKDAGIVCLCSCYATRRRSHMVDISYLFHEKHLLPFARNESPAYIFAYLLMRVGGCG